MVFSSSTEISKSDVKCLGMVVTTSKHKKKTTEEPDGQLSRLGAVTDPIVTRRFTRVKSISAILVRIYGVHLLVNHKKTRSDVSRFEPGVLSALMGTPNRESSDISRTVEFSGSSEVACSVLFCNGP